MEIKDPRINDPNEGRTVWRGDGPTVTPQARRLVESIFGPGTIVHGHGNVITESYPQFHMFCLANGEPDELLPVFNELLTLDGKTDPYDACLELVDLQGLVDAIREEGVIIDPIDKGWSEGIAFREVFYRTSWSDIVYAPKLQNWNAPLGEHPPCFRKDISYENQNEFRLAFDAHAQDRGVYLPGCLTVRMPGLAQLFRKVDLAAPAKALN